MERIYAFLPSILAIASTAAITVLWLRYVSKYFGEQLKSIEWVKNNEWKIRGFIGFPQHCIFAPTLEEIIFRAPLVIAFNSVTSLAWYGIFVSTIIFALSHVIGRHIRLEDVIEAQSSGDVDSKGADLNRAVDNFEQNNQGLIKSRKVFNVILTVPLGFLCSYYGVKYQSIWLCVGIHALWNLIAPDAIIIIVSLVIASFFICSDLIDDVRWRFSQR